MLFQCIKVRSPISCKDWSIIMKENRKGIYWTFRMESVVGQKWGFSNRLMNWIIGSEFTQRKIKAPFTLSGRTIISKILLNYCINPFHLTVRLLMMGCSKIWFGVDSRTKWSPEFRGKLGAMIRNNNIREAMISKYVKEEEFSCKGGGWDTDTRH